MSAISINPARYTLGIYYQAADEGGTILESDGDLFSISGDNMNGFVTVWRRNKS